MKVCIVPNVHIQSIVIKLSNLNCECLDTVLISVQFCMRILVSFRWEHVTCQYGTKVTL